MVKMHYSLNGIFPCRSFHQNHKNANQRAGWWKFIILNKQYNFAKMLYCLLQVLATFRATMDIPLHEDLVPVPLRVWMARQELRISVGPLENTPVTRVQYLKLQVTLTTWTAGLTDHPLRADRLPGWTCTVVSGRNLWEGQGLVLLPLGLLLKVTRCPNIISNNPLLDPSLSVAPCSTPRPPGT